MRLRLILTTALVLVTASAVVRAVSAPEGGIPDSELGLSKVTVFEVPEPDPVLYNTSDPGEVPPEPAPYPGAPPPIPHTVQDFLPLTLTENSCMDCHLVEEKVEGEPTPIPPSHFVDLRNAPEQAGEDVAGARYVCVTCHLARTGAPPLVGNDFEP